MSISAVAVTSRGASTDIAAVAEGAGEQLDLCYIRSVRYLAY